jgi:hypothetical protein
MRQSSVVMPFRFALAVGLLMAALSLSLAGTARAANDPVRPIDEGLASIEIAPPTSDSLLVDQAEPTHAEQGDNDLPAGAWVGIAVALAFALLLLVGSLAYILPKPPQR